MIFSLFKPFKILDLYAPDVVFLYHQTSDKRLLWTNGNGIESLTGFKTKSSGSSDLHSGRAEVWTESLLSMSINLRKIVLRSVKSWFGKMTDWKKPRFPKISRSERMSSDKQSLFIVKAGRKVGWKQMSYLKLRPWRLDRKKQSDGQPEDDAVTSINGRFKAGRKGCKAKLNSQL